ncbi:MAG: HD superfamily phosphohydrolase [Hyperionvirus sp.]|uniref:HD superfamily phosphohydrolase n=1 Tax=Hyperionvirus sp. TaxID=2487770 RepID=A0A3G5ABG6_9VIRU|nr:MAG: HD superfamily phosphohydrolase [Hyperionvirus sp.]
MRPHFFLSIIIVTLCLIYQNLNDTKHIIRAYSFAAAKHNGQVRKNIFSTPYINHPIEVTQLLSDAGIIDDDILIAGLLHDTIEDTDTTPEQIENSFGKRVLEMVLECSHNTALDKINQRKFQLNNMKNISYGSKLIKMADGYSNLSELLNYPPINWSQEKINGYKIFLYARYCETANVNSHFDKIYTDLFNKHNISVKNKNDLDDKLENYYKNL